MGGAAGILHLFPDALSAQEVTGLDRFPLAAFLAAISFFSLLFLHRILSPALRLKPHLHTTFVRCPTHRLPCWLHAFAVCCSFCPIAEVVHVIVSVIAHKFKHACHSTTCSLSRSQESKAIRSLS